MSCEHRPPCFVSYVDASELAQAHIAAGIEQTRCPACGLWYWPWEYPPPITTPTGLTWVASSTSRITIPASITWWLRTQDPEPLGHIYEMTWPVSGPGCFVCPSRLPRIWMSGAKIGDAARELIEITHTRTINAKERLR